jgi:hypothetical protein
MIWPVLSLYSFMLSASMINFIMLSVILLIVVTLYFVTLSTTTISIKVQCWSNRYNKCLNVSPMLRDNRISVVQLNVILLKVAAPFSLTWFDVFLKKVKKFSDLKKTDDHLSESKVIKLFTAVIYKFIKLDCL